MAQELLKNTQIRDAIWHGHLGLLPWIPIGALFLSQDGWNAILWLSGIWYGILTIYACAAGAIGMIFLFISAMDAKRAPQRLWVALLLVIDAPLFCVVVAVLDGRVDFNTLLWDGMVEISSAWLSWLMLIAINAWTNPKPDAPPNTFFFTVAVFCVLTGGIPLIIGVLVAANPGGLDRWSLAATGVFCVLATVGYLRGKWRHMEDTFSIPRMVFTSCGTLLGLLGTACAVTYRFLR